MSFYAGMMAGLNKRRNPLDEDEDTPHETQNRLLASSFDDDDEVDGPLNKKDSYDEMMGATKFPQISTPSIAPLNPFELSPPQATAAPAPTSGDHTQNRSNPLDYSIDSGGNTMSSYYANNAWDNTAAEEDDDEDSDYHKSDVLSLLDQERQVVTPKKRLTRMRSKSNDVASGEKPKKTKGKRKKSKKRSQQQQQARPTGPVRSDSYGKYSSSELNYGALFPSTHVMVEPSAQDIEVLSLNDVDEDDDEDEDEDEEEGNDSDSGASASQDLDSFDGTGEDPHASLEQSGASSIDVSNRSEDQVMVFSNEESPVKAAAVKPSGGNASRTVQFGSLSPSAETNSSIDLSDKEGRDKESRAGGRRHSVLSDDEDSDSDRKVPSRVTAAAQARRNPLDASLEIPKTTAPATAAAAPPRANPLDYESEEDEGDRRQQRQPRAASQPEKKDAWASQPPSSSSSTRAPVVAAAQGSPARPIVKLPSASPSTSGVRKDPPRELDLGEPGLSVDLPERIPERAVPATANSAGSTRRPIMTEQEKAEDRRQRIEQIKANMLQAKRERLQQYSPKAAGLSNPTPSQEVAPGRPSSLTNKKTASQNRVSFDQSLSAPTGESLAIMTDAESEEERHHQMLMPTKLYEDQEFESGGGASPSNRGAGSANPLSSSVNKNPLYNSATSLHTDYSGQSSTAAAAAGQNNAILCSLPITLQLPSLSEYAAESGVIFEGYLGKKSKTTGLFQRRYFVLSESASYFAVLRIYASAVETKWGVVPTSLRTSIPIGAIESVTTTATPASKGIEFTIKFSPSSLVAPEVPATRFGGSQAGSESGSVFSSFFGSTSKQSVLHADDAEVRLLWVTILNKVLSIFLDNLPEQH